MSIKCVSEGFSQCPSSRFDKVRGYLRVFDAWRRPLGVRMRPGRCGHTPVRACKGVFGVCGGFDPPAIDRALFAHTVMMVALVGLAAPAKGHFLPRQDRCTSVCSCVRVCACGCVSPALDSIFSQLCPRSTRTLLTESNHSRSKQCVTSKRPSNPLSMSQNGHSERCAVNLPRKANPVRRQRASITRVVRR